MSDTPIWEQTVWDLLIDPDESLEMYRAYSDLKFMVINISSSAALTRLRERLQDLADRYRER